MLREEINPEGFVAYHDKDLFIIYVRLTCIGVTLQEVRQGSGLLPHPAVMSSGAHSFKGEEKKDGRFWHHDLRDRTKSVFCPSICLA